MSKLYYAAPNASGDYVIWVTDGTLAGTRNIFGGTQNFGVRKAPMASTGAGDDEVFAALDPTGYVAVWVTKGTARARSSSCPVSRARAS